MKPEASFIALDWLFYNFPGSGDKIIPRQLRLKADVLFLGPLEECYNFPTPADPIGSTKQNANISLQIRQVFDFPLGKLKNHLKHSHYTPIVCLFYQHFGWLTVLESLATRSQVTKPFTSSGQDLKHMGPWISYMLNHEIKFRNNRTPCDNMFQCYLPEIFSF